MVWKWGGSAAVWVLFLGILLFPESAVGQSLRGSTASMDLQNRQARYHDFTFIRDAAQVRRFVEAGYLVPVRDGRDYYLKGVSFPYARPEVRLFIQRLASQYRRACGEQLVVTSLTRPKDSQPRNASPRTVHPTGMALDLRRSSNGQCRRWLEDVLLSLEGQGVLEATRERYPPHYHIALFPKPYARYVELLIAQGKTSDDRTVRTADASYEVRRGDSLWEIARAHGVTVDELRSANNLRSSRIYVGQKLKVPAAR